ncbi:MAG: hypothetical protein AB1646_02955 [Thermodesulfobacteriota bacterium]
MRTLEEEIKVKDEALAAARERHAKERATLPTMVSVPRYKDSPGGGPSIPEQPAIAPDPEFSEPARRQPTEKRPARRPDASASSRVSAQPPDALHPDQRGSDAARQARMRFKAEDLTVTEETPNKGDLSFRLVTDMPEIAFAGYLFVYVETQDKKGGDQIVMFPEKVPRIPGDLFPRDYRDGIGVLFKKSRPFAFAYEDRRRGASLSRVTILLYNEDGDIVFQAPFDRSELKVGKTKDKSPKARGSHQKPPRTPL